MTGHLSALVFDELALGVLPELDAARARAHLDKCPSCRDDRDAAAARRAEFRPRALHVPKRQWWWLAAPVLAAAAVMAFVATRHAPAAEPDLMIKGDASWQVFARRGERTFQVHDGAALAAGDRVRFVVVPDRARYLLVASIDGSGHASIYFPFDGAHSGKLDGARVELPDSVVLDDSHGPERLFALFSDDPLDAAAVSELLHAIGEHGAAAIRATTHLDVKLRAQRTLLIEKAAP